MTSEARGERSEEASPPLSLPLPRRVHRVECGLLSGNCYCCANTNSDRNSLSGDALNSAPDGSSFSAKPKQTRAPGHRKCSSRECTEQPEPHRSSLAKRSHSERENCTKGFGEEERRASGNPQAGRRQAIQHFNAFQATFHC